MRKIIKNVFECGEKEWSYVIFVIIFFIVFLLHGLNIFKLNQNLITAFSLGTVFITISDLIDKNVKKRFFYLLGLSCYFIIPNCDLMVRFINAAISNDGIMLYSIIFVFFSLITNANKEEINNKNLRLIDFMIRKFNDRIEFINHMINTIKNIVSKYNKTLERENNIVETYNELLKSMYNSLDEQNKNKFLNEFNECCTNLKRLKEEIIELKSSTKNIGELEELEKLNIDNN